MKVVRPFDFSVIFIVPTLIIWPINPPHFIKVELIISDPISCVPGTDVNPWDIHDISFECFDIRDESFLGHLVGINRKDVITVTLCSVIVPMIRELSIKLPLVDDNLVIIRLQYLSNFGCHIRRINEDVDFIFLTLNLKEKVYERVKLPIFVTYTDGVGNLHHL